MANTTTSAACALLASFCLATVAAAQATASRGEAAGVALAAALASRDRAAFEAAVEAGADGRGTQVGERSLLSVAAAFDAPSAIRALVGRGEEVDRVDPHGETALFAAAAAGASRAVIVLLELGADPGLASHSWRAPGWTPLFAASMSGHADIVSRLLAAPGAAGLAAQVDRDGRTALFHAALHGQLPVVRLLLEAGADPDASDAGGQTPRSIAAKAGRRGVLDEMAGAGARSRP